jgi:hypothetical protein
MAGDFTKRLLRPCRAGRNVAVVSLVPIVLGWLLVYALVYLVRWIRAGFTLGSNRLSQELKRATQKAAADRRTLSGLLEKLLVDYCREQGFLKGRK